MRRPDGPECLYLDFDSFFAGAEQSFQPHLHRRPVGVLPVMSPSTCVIAASREAKQFGIRTGTPVREAAKLCPDIVFVPARHDKYVKLHHQLIELVDTIVPVKAVRSIDEITCRLLRNEQACAVEIAQEIKQRIRDVFGPALTCSVGLAGNELLAKIAAEMNKPDGLVWLKPQHMPQAILHLNLTDIPGIGHGNAARLKRAGIGTIQELWNLAPKQMRILWGSVEGERLWSWLHGYDAERQETSRRMFGHSRVLAWDWRNEPRTRACARLLTAKAARRMRRDNFAAAMLSLNLYCKDGPRVYGEHRFPAAVYDDHSILQALEGLLDEAFIKLKGCPPKYVHVFLHHLVPQERRLRDLFDDAVGGEKRRAWEKLSIISDRLAQRYHAEILSLGLTKQPPGGYAGGKIAFNRVPELADF